VEEGSFDFLKENGAVFKDLWKHQQAKMKVEVAD
jgi:hypothetical protein